MPTRSLVLFAFLSLGMLTLGAQNPQGSEETVPLRYVSVYQVLSDLVEAPMPEGAAGQGKPVAFAVGAVKLMGDPVANTLTFSGPAAEVTRLKAAAALLDRKPRQIIVEAAIGQWTLRGIGKPEECVGSRLPRWKWDPQKAPVQPDGTLRASAWRVGIGLGDLLQGLPRDFKLLSKPTVFTLDRLPVHFPAGPRVWTLQANAPEVGCLTLEVIPTLQDTGEIQLDLQGKWDPQPQLPFNQVPHLATAPFQTTLTVPSGQSVYVGGVFLEDAEGGRVELPIFVSPKLVEVDPEQ